MRNRRYIGGVGGGSSFFKQSNNPGDYTTEDIVVKRGHVIPKGTYIGVGAVNEDFIKLLPDNLKRSAQTILYDLRVGGSTNWYEHNKDKFNSFGSRFREQDRGPATLHAEIGCVLGLVRTATSGADVYVCRINKKGEFRYSKPCAMCHQVLKHVGVKRVYYTTNEDVIEMYKL